MGRQQASSLRPPNRYVIKAGLQHLYEHIGHWAIAHGYDPAPLQMEAAVMCVFGYLHWHRIVREKGEAATIQDRSELEGYRRLARKYMAEWGALDPRREHVAEVDELGRDLDLVRLAEDRSAQG